LDTLDQKLVMQLQLSGRLSHVALAKLLGVNERTIRNRIKNLLDKDIIKIRAVPNLNTLGYDFTGIVGVQIQMGRLKSIAAALAKHPNICYIINVTGQYDFIIIIFARSPKEFASIMEDFVSPIPGILRTETFVGLNTYKGEKGNMDTGRLISSVSL
jgi:Lrp/AsnC family transcriptional regulator, regulator for asnA, asnC and gidA